MSLTLHKFNASALSDLLRLHPATGLSVKLSVLKCDECSTSMSRTFPWSFSSWWSVRQKKPTPCPPPQLAFPGSLLVPSGSHILLHQRKKERSIQLIVRRKHKPQSTFLKAVYKQTLFQFLITSCCTQVGVLLQQTQTITAVRGREGGRGKIARGAAQSEWSSHPWGSDGASSLTTNTSPPLVPKQKKNPHANNRKRRTKNGKTNKSRHTHGAHTLTHALSRDRNTPDGTQSALKPDRHATETRLIQMISQLCCHIRKWEHLSKKFSWWLLLSLLLPGPDSI